MTTKTCEHCYCRTINVTSGLFDRYAEIPHKVCCNCGNKQATIRLTQGNDMVATDSLTDTKALKSAQGGTNDK